MNLEEIKEHLKANLKPSRYEHTLGVAKTAVLLAKRYGCDAFKAEIAAFLHDCAKCMDEEEQIQICQKYEASLTESELSNYALIHAKTGAVLAREVYGITDSEIIHAIAFHTTGCENMSLLDKIIYIADYIEPGRDQAPRLKELRQEVLEDIDLALFHILEDSVSYLQNSGKHMDPTTLKTYEFYKSRR